VVKSCVSARLTAAVRVVLCAAHHSSSSRSRLTGNLTLRAMASPLYYTMRIVYPNVNLATARLLHADARGLLARDIDPSKCVPAAIPDTPLRLDSAESQSRRAPGRELRARCPRRILSAISKIVWGAGNVGRSTRIGNRPGAD
jgi:hypothetical protein